MPAVSSLTATYVSDSRVNLSWSLTGTSYPTLRILRYSASGAVSVVANISGSSTSWADTSVRADERYRWAIAGRSSDGLNGPLVYTGYISTTPDAPSAVAAAKNAGGDIVVTWTDNSTAETNFQVEDETTNVGNPTSSPFTHVGPSAMVTHRYRVRAVADGPRYSAWSPYSNVVTLLAPPAAPDDLTPNGSPFALDDPLVLEWTHNPTDTTPQTAYELRHQPEGGSWTTVTGTTAEQHTVADYVTQQTIEWQVRTKGAHADWSPWSAVASVPLTPRPTVAITEPSGDVTSPYVTVEWSYYHAGGGAQSGWEVQILDGSTVVAQGSGTDTAAEWTSDDELPNGSSLTANVRVREPSGLWSDWESEAFDVNYDPPPASDVTAVWQDGYGHVLVTAEKVDEVGEPETVAHRVARSVDGGNTWTLVADDLGPVTSINDWEAPAGGTYHYRITALSALPSATHTVVEVTVPATPVNCAIWIGGGPGFAHAAQIVWNPTTSVNGGRERRLNVYSGRTHPVETSSRQVPRTLWVQATIFPDRHNEDAATVEDLQDVFDTPGPHLYRDHTGRVMYGTLSPLDASTDVEGVTSISFSITRTARGTDAQLASLSEFYAPRIAEVAPGVYQVIGADVVEAAPGVYEEVE